jgi:hypothetical protein
MPAQRMVIDFANQGRVTVNTAYASIVPEGTDLASVAPRKTSPASGAAPTSGGGAAFGGGGGWLAELERSQNTANSPAAAGNGDSLTMLPDKCSDPFMPLGRRLMHTLDLYRFSSEPRSLIDWAVAQTHLQDPLSRHTRHELEHGFAIFSQMRDSHLKELIRLIKRKGEQTLIAEAREHPLPAARAALDKALRTL